MTRSPWDEVHVRGDVAKHARRIHDATEPVTDEELTEPPELQQLRWARWVQTEAAQLVEAAVLEAREAGASWATIGATFGTTRQAAQQRFGHVQR
jgi:hypothetical protein